MTDPTTQDWLKWTNADKASHPPAPHPDHAFLSALRNPTGHIYTGRTLARIASQGYAYALDQPKHRQGNATWLQALILAHQLFNADHGQGDYGFTDTEASDAMVALLPGAFPPAREPAASHGPTPHRTPTGELIPERLFPDHAFRTAADTGRQLTRLTVSPEALQHLRNTLRTHGLTRHTDFKDTPSVKGAVPAHAATYRSVRVATHRQMQDQFLAEYTDGSLTYHQLDDTYRVIQATGPRF